MTSSTSSSSGVALNFLEVAAARVAFDGPIMAKLSVVETRFSRQFGPNA